MELFCIKERLLCVPQLTAEVPSHTVRPHLASHVGPATLREVTHNHQCYHRRKDTTESYVPTASHQRYNKRCYLRIFGTITSHTQGYPINIPPRGTEGTMSASAPLNRSQSPCSPKKALWVSVTAYVSYIRPEPPW